MSERTVLKPVTRRISYFSLQQQGLEVWGLAVSFSWLMSTIFQKGFETTEVSWESRSNACLELQTRHRRRPLRTLSLKVDFAKLPTMRKVRREREC